MHGVINFCLLVSRYDDKAKDINSPDSNDSGIQADVQHVRGLLNDDLYAVVKPRPRSQGQEDKQQNHQVCVLDHCVELAH